MRCPDVSGQSIKGLHSHASNKEQVMEEIDLKEIVENIKYLADAKDWAMIRNMIVDLHPADLAEILHYLDDEHRNYIFDLLDAETASDVISEMDDVSRDDILEDLHEERISEIVDEMDSDDAADLVSDLPDDVAQKVLDSIDKEDSDEVKELLRHEEDTAGGIMAKEFVAVKISDTIDRAIEQIRSKADEVEDVFYLYIVDEHEKLVGVAPLKDLILALFGKFCLWLGKGKLRLLNQRFCLGLPNSFKKNFLLL